MTNKRECSRFSKDSFPELLRTTILFYGRRFPEIVMTWSQHRSFGGHWPESTDADAISTEQVLKDLRNFSLASLKKLTESVSHVYNRLIVWIASLLRILALTSLINSSEEFIQTLIHLFSNCSILFSSYLWGCFLLLRYLACLLFFYLTRCSSVAVVSILIILIILLTWLLLVLLVLLNFIHIWKSPVNDDSNHWILVFEEILRDILSISVKTFLG